MFKNEEESKSNSTIITNSRVYTLIDDEMIITMMMNWGTVGGRMALTS